MENLGDYCAIRIIEEDRAGGAACTQQRRLTRSPLVVVAAGGATWSLLDVVYPYGAGYSDVHVRPV